MSNVMDKHYGWDSITDLYSHVNMLVVGKHAEILNDTGNKVDVIPFTSDYQVLENLSIVDSAVQYLCQYMAKVYVLVFSNALSEPSTENNLIPPFVMRYADLVVKDTEKIHAMDPSVGYHSIYFSTLTFTLHFSKWYILILINV